MCRRIQRVFGGHCLQVLPRHSLPHRLLADCCERHHHQWEREELVQWRVLQSCFLLWDHGHWRKPQTHSESAFRDQVAAKLLQYPSLALLSVLFVLKCRLIVNSDTYILEPNDYVIQTKRVDGDGKESLYCAANIFEVTDAPDDNTIILGEPFLRKYYTIFDRQRI